MNNKFLATGSVALMGAGSLLGASAAQAYTDADCGEQSGMFITGLYEGTENVCFSVAFGAGDYTFQAPEGSTAVEVVLSGSGGGASTAGYGYAGGGGEVLFIDDLDITAEFSISLGEGGGNAADGGDSTITDGTTTHTARGGEASGASGNGNASYVLGDGYTKHGAGSGGDATADGPGVGQFLNDPAFVGVDNPLWPASDESQYGAGGSGTQLEDDNWGNGGDAFYDGTSWTLEGGRDGNIEVRYQLADTTPLASTGVDANAIGMTAGALGLGGVALAVVAAARRARRVK